MCVCVFVFFIDINSMSHYTVILHASHNLSFSFTITFTFNDNKTIVEVHYNVDNNILTSSLIINNIYILSEIYLSVYLSIFYNKASLQICKVYKFTKFYKNLQIIIDECFICRRPIATSVFICFIISFLWLRNFLH